MAGPKSTKSEEDCHKSFVKEGAKVLAYDRMSPLLYEATVIKIEEKPEVYYFVHYLNWSKKWDEWVKPSRVLELNETNKALAEKIKKDFAKKTADEKSKKRKGVDKKGNDTTKSLSNSKPSSRMEK